MNELYIDKCLQKWFIYLLFLTSFSHCIMFALIQKVLFWLFMVLRVCKNYVHYRSKEIFFSP